VNAKAEQADIDLLNDKLERNLKLLNRDLKIKDKRIRDLESNHNSGTNKRLNSNNSKGQLIEDKSLESLTRNDLEPKLPWMKVGDRIS